MNTKADWQAVGRQLREEDRRGAGEPPTADEVLAYTRGELPPEEEASVRERLLCHPDLVRTLTEPFPAEGAKRGDPDYLTDAEYEFHWAAMQKKMQKPVQPVSQPGRVLHFWRFAAAVAAAISVVLGASLWQANQRLAEPRVVAEQQVLFPDGRRGGGLEAATLSAHGESVLLVVPLIGQNEYQQYRLELVDAASRSTVWKSEPLALRDDETFTLLVSRRFFRPGTYEVVVSGITGATEERVATYSLRVPTPHR
ncbi:MAG: hypothetical protein DMF56_23600 [Acidobacteria bacterium]|nr:MAG: hypothetical protein DMF56_23600 [Acidobacteriota bacterium]